MKRLSLALVLLVGLVAAACTPGVDSGSPAATDQPLVSPEASMPAESLPVESLAPGSSPAESTTP